jgi:hypothetical protein
MSEKAITRGKGDLILLNERCKERMKILCVFRYGIHFPGFFLKGGEGVESLRRNELGWNPRPSSQKATGSLLSNLLKMVDPVFRFHSKANDIL